VNVISVTSSTHLGQKSPCAPPKSQIRIAITQLHARELRGRQLAEHLSKLPLGACLVSFVEALLKFVEVQPAGFVVAAQLAGDPRPVSVGNEQVRNLGHPPIVERSTFAKTDRRER